MKLIINYKDGQRKVIRLNRVFIRFLSNSLWFFSGMAVTLLLVILEFSK